VPFREAHHVTGRLVRRADEKGVALEGLKLSDMRAVEPRITKAVFAVLGPENAVRLRTSAGGTAPKLVRRAVMQARKRYL
jgi:argininosuccinate lyase